jgi:hypothetical protein
VSCGCTASAVPTDERRARSAMCQLCIWAEHDSASPWGVGAVNCTISGRPVAEHILSPEPSCPKKRHGPVLLWAKLWWYGVPRFLRWGLAWRTTGGMPGCGCCKPLKDRWMAFKERRWPNSPTK